MNLFNVSIITPDGVVFEGPVAYIVAPGVDGEFTIMAGHAPLIAATRTGVLKVAHPTSEQFFAMGESLVEVSKEQTLVLANQAVSVASHAEAQKQAGLYAQEARASSSK